MAPSSQPTPTRLAAAASADPAAYQRGGEYTVNTDVEDIYQRWDRAVPPEELPAYQEMAAFLVAEAPRTEKELAAAVIRMRRQFKAAPKRSQLNQALATLEAAGRVEPQPELHQL